MTLAQFEDLVRRRHRAESDSNWSSAEIYQLITGRANEILSIIGLLEATDSSTSTTVGVQAYSFPSDAVRMKQINWDGQMLQEISFRDWETQKAAGTTPSGKPTHWVNWNRQALLVPVPSSAKVLTFYYEKEHPYIDGTSVSVISIPSVLHWRHADGVVADMYAKDLNYRMFDRYQTIWIDRHVPAFFTYASRSKRGGRSRIVTDADSHPQTDYGTY